MRKLLLILSVFSSLLSNGQMHINGTGTHVHINGTGTPITINYEPPYMRIREYEYATNYNAWGVEIPYNNKNLQFYSSARKHAGQCESRLLIKDEWGKKIKDTLIWSDLTKSRRDHGGGKLSTGTIIVFYVEHLVDVNGNDSALTGMGYYRSTDGFATFTDHPNSLEIPVGEPDVSNYGNIIQNPLTNRAYHTAYGVSPTNRMLTYYTDDDGLTFPLISTTGATDQISEGAMFPIEWSSNNSLSKIGYFVRNDVGVPEFWRSTNGASIFSFVENISWASTASKAPWAENDGNKTILLWTDRSPYNYLIRAAEFRNDSLAVTTSTLNARTNYRTIYESNITSRPFSSSNLPGNFGYATLSKNGTRNKWWVGLYDMSPRQMEPYTSAYDTVQCDLVFVPYEADVRVKARATGTKTFADNSTTPLVLEDVVEDSHGAWNNNKFIAPVSDTYHVAFNFPIQPYGTKIFRVKKNGIENYTYTESEGLASAIGKLQSYYDVYLNSGDSLTFEVSVSGAGTSITSAAGTTPTGGVAFSIGITNAKDRAIVNNSTIASTSYSDGVASVMKSYTVAETGWYKINFTSSMPNAPGGRRIFNIYNYEVGQTGQEVRRKLICQVEDKAMAGANTTTDCQLFYKLNAGETIKLWFTIYGTSITSNSGTFKVTRQ